jgi:hypothetical protein
MSREETLWWLRIVNACRTEAELQILWAETGQLPEGNWRLQRLLMLLDARRVLRMDWRAA